MSVANLFLLLLILPLSCSAQSVEDLGVITPRHAIVLEKPIMPDFLRFHVEILPQNKLGLTNKIEILTTNTLLTMDQLVAVPHGRNIMGLRTVSRDGEESPLLLYSFDLRRDGPPQAHAHKATIAGAAESKQRIEHVIQSKRAVATGSPPLPPGVSARTNLINFNGPLVHATNQSYSDYLDHMAEVRSRGLRRGE